MPSNSRVIPVHSRHLTSRVKIKIHLPYNYLRKERVSKRVNNAIKWLFGR